MTHSERVIKAINHQETDFTPYQIDLTQRAQERLTEYVGDPGFIQSMGCHIVGCWTGTREEIPGGFVRDHWGVTWNRTVDKDIGVVEGLVIPEPTLAGWKAPEVNVELLRERAQQAIDGAEDKFKIFSISFSMFERAWTLRGMENVLMDMITDPEFVHELLDAICEYNLKLIDIALEFPFDGIYFGDDWGQQSGTIMGPKFWREFIKPRMAKMYARAKGADKYVLQHSCGDIYEIFPDLVEIGLDVYNTFQPEIYDIAKVKREFGNDLSFWGGISTQQLLPYASPEEVQRVTREIMGIMGQGGGYIVAPTHSVPGDVPPENLVALIDVFKNQ